MKKHSLLIASSIGFCIFLGTLGLIKLSHQNVPVFKSISGPILIDRLQGKNFDLRLFYSDLTLSQIQTYEVNHQHVTPIDTAYSSYTEGFIEEHKNTQILDAVNHYRLSHNLPPISYYHNYEEANGYGFLSLAEGLDSLYIIRLATHEVFTPSLNVDYALEKQYVYHVCYGNHTYYLLTAKANSYEAYWYALSPDDFHIIRSKKLMPPSKATKRNQYALDSEGNAYFVSNNSLFIATKQENITLPLQFNPEVVFFANDQIYALSASELFLNYAIYDEDFGLIRSGQVNLPNKFVRLVSWTIQDSTLYTITYDSEHPLYRNYITLYDLSSNNILYCQALKDPSSHSLALLDAIYLS